MFSLGFRMGQRTIRQKTNIQSVSYTNKHWGRPTRRINKSFLYHDERRTSRIHRKPFEQPKEVGRTLSATVALFRGHFEKQLADF